MKRTLIIVLPLFLFIGCGKKETLELKEDGKTYSSKTNEPYNGTWIEWNEDGSKEQERTYKDGKSDGLWTFWYEDGQKRIEGTLKKGKKDGLWILWYENGQKREEETLKDGKRDGKRNRWYENGQKRFEGSYEDGELISEKCWDEDGNQKVGFDDETLSFRDLFPLQ